MHCNNMSEPKTQKDVELGDKNLSAGLDPSAVGHEAGPAPSHDLDAADTKTKLIADARNANDEEHRMTLRTALRLYPKAIGWSVLLSSTLIMEGYDLALLGSLYASPVFNQKFGTQDPKTGKWAVSAAWQSGLSNGARAGEIIGLILAGWMADRFGYKYTTIGALLLMIVFVFVLFFAPNIQVLVVGEILCGKYSTRSKEIMTYPTLSDLISKVLNVGGI